MSFDCFAMLIFVEASCWTLTRSPHNKVARFRPEFNMDKDSGPIKKGTHPLIRQSRTLQSGQKGGLGMWRCDIKAPVEIK